MAMQKGFAGVQEAIKKAQSRGSGGGGGLLPYFGWSDDREKEGVKYKRIVRFLTDDVITCSFYEYIPVNGGKVRDFVNPASLDSSREDHIKASGIKVPKFNDKTVLQDPRPRDMTVGLAVLREEVQKNVDGVRRMVVQDKIVKNEFERDGRKVVEEGLWFGVVKQGHKNFWHALIALHSRYGTICDRDYEITRTGNGTDTTYQIIPLDPVEELRDPEALRKHYKLDQIGKREPVLDESGAEKKDDSGNTIYKPFDRFKPSMTLDAFVEKLASKEYFDNLTSERLSAQKSESSSSSSESTSSSESSEEKVDSSASGGSFASLRDELIANQ